MQKNSKVLFLAAVMTVCTIFPAAAQRNIDIAEAPSTTRLIADHVLMYLPNRFMDMLDIFSLKFGTGAAAKLNLKFTHAVGFGFGIGPTAVVEWGYGRRIGTALDQGTEISFIGDGRYDLKREYTTGTLKDYWYQSNGMQWPEDPIFSKEKAFDYWALEVEAAAFIDVKVEIHPVQILDFLAGVICLDRYGDDDYRLIVD